MDQVNVRTVITGLSGAHHAPLTWREKFVSPVLLQEAGKLMIHEGQPPITPTQAALSCCLQPTSDICPEDLLWATTRPGTAVLGAS